MGPFAIQSRLVFFSGRKHLTFKGEKNCSEFGLSFSAPPTALTRPNPTFSLLSSPSPVPALLEHIGSGYCGMAAVQCSKIPLPATEVRFPVMACAIPWKTKTQIKSGPTFHGRLLGLRILAVSSDGGTNSSKKSAAPNSNYVVPLDKSSSITRPLAEILRDLNKRVPDNIIKTQNDQPTFIPWYQANRMLSFYAPGWCGEIRDVIFSENGSVTVVYRVTVRGSDGEAHRESTGTVTPGESNIVDPVAAAEEIAFCRACARFGLGLYLYHED
ncbi:cobalt ion binding [Striga asiatica]|uniref:Cobalt ion binding n=1 Tax=Striga asiatica TaxID=4170 RepID=A0A5A7QND7_STRAF|nr:cobalt ion binding [Striga asiatica]